MVIAKIYQIRPKDKIVVVLFYNEEELNNEFVEHFGSRGYCLSDDELNYLMNLTVEDLLKYKNDGITVPDSIDEKSDTIEKIVYNAYQEYLKAKQINDEMSNDVIEL